MMKTGTSFYCRLGDKYRYGFRYKRNKIEITDEEAKFIDRKELTIPKRIIFKSTSSPQQRGLYIDWSFLKFWKWILNN